MLTKQISVRFPHFYSERLEISNLNARDNA